MKLSAIVLTRNEERNISECLKALAWAEERVVVDSGSTDSTCLFAKELGAKVFAHPFKDFAEQRNYAMEVATGDWLLFIDADERVPATLAGEIQGVLGATAPLAVYSIPRQTFFFGRPLRFCDSRDDAPIRLFPRKSVHWVQPVHETVETGLPCRRLKNPILHYTTRDLAHYLAKLPDYLSLEIATMKANDVKPRLWNVLVRPVVKFFHLYFWKLGILDGIAGFQYAILSAYYMFKKHWNFWKLYRKDPA